MNAREVLRNQRVFREVNERIAQITLRQEALDAEFLCECGRDDCASAITLDVNEYESLRGQDGFFLLVPGHAVEGVDRVVESRDGYELVVAVVEEEAAG
jgi:hypothetical protein